MAFLCNRLHCKSLTNNPPTPTVSQSMSPFNKVLIHIDRKLHYCKEFPGHASIRSRAPPLIHLYPNKLFSPSTSLCDSLHPDTSCTCGSVVLLSVRLPDEIPSDVNLIWWHLIFVFRNVKLIEADALKSLERYYWYLLGILGYFKGLTCLFCDISEFFLCVPCTRFLISVCRV